MKRWPLDAKRLYDCFNSHQLSGHLRWYGKPGRPDRIKTVSGFVEFVAIETDKRAARRLKEIGRPAYALELCAREAAREAAAKRRDRVEWIISCAKRGVNVAENIKNDFEAPAGLQKEVA